MDRSMVLERLEMPRRPLAESDEHVARQREIIAKIKKRRQRPGTRRRKSILSWD